MNECDQTRRLSAYMDGEMPPAEAFALTGHLAQCLACQAELRSLRAVVALLTPPHTSLSKGALRTIHGGVDTWSRRGPARLAGALTALAACLAVASSLSLMRKTEAVPAPLPWEATALRATDDTSNSKEVAVAEWMVADLSHGGANGE